MKGSLDKLYINYDNRIKNFVFDVSLIDLI